MVIEHLRFICDHCHNKFGECWFFNSDRLEISELKKAYREHRKSDECRGSPSLPKEITEDDRWFM